MCVSNRTWVGLRDPDRTFPLVPRKRKFDPFGETLRGKLLAGHPRTNRPPESTPARRERSRKKAAGLSGSDPLLIMRGFARAGF